MFSDNRRLSASVRDFARIAWFWLNRGRWGERQILTRHYFDDYLRPQVPGALPVSRPADQSVMSSNRSCRPLIHGRQVLSSAVIQPSRRPIPGKPISASRCF